MSCHELQLDALMQEWRRDVGSVNKRVFGVLRLGPVQPDSVFCGA